MTSNICRVSSISGLLPPPAQTKPPRQLRLLPPPMAGCASAALPYPPTLASPSLYSPTRPVILRRCQPQHTPAPEPVNPRTPLHLRLDRRIFHGSCSFRPRPHCRPRPWFARRARCTALLRCQRRPQTTGISRGLYVERLIVWTHQGHCISQAGALLLQAKKILPPNCLTTRSHAIFNVVNKRENYTTSG